MTEPGEKLNPHLGVNLITKKKLCLELNLKLKMTSQNKVAKRIRRLKRKIARLRQRLRKLQRKGKKVLRKEDFSTSLTKLKLG